MGERPGMYQVSRRVGQCGEGSAPVLVAARVVQGLGAAAILPTSLAVVNQLYDASASGDLDRLKMCASEECRRVFYDRSKPGTRRWCQASLCGNRMKTRAYRERHKT